MSFTILVDTGSDLPEEYIKEHGIEIIPIPFRLDDVQHNGGSWQEISDKEFYKALGGGSVASTTLINPESFSRAFAEYAEAGKDLLVITLSSGLSGTYQNSQIALDEIKGQYPDCGIYTVDSLNAAGGEGLVTTLAVRKRGEGLSAAETAAWLEENKHHCLSLFTVDDLMYLHRGGRLSKLSAVAGSIIGIKPLLNVAPDGTLKLKDKIRGRKGALEKLFSQMKRSIEADTELDSVIISHSDCIDDAETLAEMVRSTYTVKNVHVVMLGPVIGAHVGPGTVALFFEGDMTRTEYEAKFY
jgi:DegV family protein with EDD domain